MVGEQAGREESPARNATALATSSDSFSRRSGEAARNSESIRSEVDPPATAAPSTAASRRSPSVGPGETRLTRTPNGPASSPRLHTSPMSALLDAA